MFHRAGPLLVLLLPAVLGAAVYHVDFAAGDDANPGLTPEQPWKRAPGDPAAGGNPAKAALAPGDTVLLRGGVVYRGMIRIPASGAPGAPITYRGSGWGEGRAIIDGAEPVAGWRPCAAPEEAPGCRDWAKLWVAEVAADSAFTLNLHELEPGGSVDASLHLAQDPPPRDPFFYDRKDSFHTVKNADITRTSLTAPGRLPAAEALAGAALLLWVNPNATTRREITAVDAIAGRVEFAELGAAAIYPDRRDQAWALINSPAAIVGPGTYAVASPGAEGRRRILLWPRHAAPPEGRIMMARRTCGIAASGRSHLVVEGFAVRRCAGAGMREGTGICIIGGGEGGKDITVRGNLVHDNASAEKGYGGIHLADVTGFAVEDNVVQRVARNAGIFITGCAEGTVRGNRIERPGATALRLYSCRRVAVLGNRIDEACGTHANGITIYIASREILVGGNHVTRSATPITFQDSGDLWFIGNRIDGGGSFDGVNEWGNTRRGPWATGRILFLNNTIVRNPEGGALSIGKDKAKTYLVRNNILDGIAGSAAERFNRSHNLYTGRSWTQADRYGWAFAEGEAEVRDLVRIFADPEGPDFRRRPDGPAHGTGTDITDLLPRELFPTVDFDALVGGLAARHIGAP